MIEFADWLSRTRFLYLSSFASQDFVLNLCARGVPALASFRWNIDDSMARRHSQAFYEELFQRRSIEDALFRAWNRMFGQYRVDRVWASMQLVMG
ncbi:CHAT domain-containing protein [Variovorax sp. J22P240]|uniref:CHAT domain-containing protein n=1 Tax=Variovorax sp. J22P240 TaxID=3053514 RepID=UPI0025780638|nr:CHAT domain-containing protein [Variovorax sp. J22P240]MDM0002833.1 CHAT domain-containing protein [Variovorax sp. J22P240]